MLLQMLLACETTAWALRSLWLSCCRRTPTLLLCSRRQSQVTILRLTYPLANAQLNAGRPTSCRSDGDDPRATSSPSYQRPVAARSISVERASLQRATCNVELGFYSVRAESSPYTKEPNDRQRSGHKPSGARKRGFLNRFKPSTWDRPNLLDMLGGEVFQTSVAIDGFQI